MVDLPKPQYRYKGPRKVASIAFPVPLLARLDRLAEELRESRNGLVVMYMTWIADQLEADIAARSHEPKP